MQQQADVRVETVSSSEVDGACTDLWVHTVATRDGVPESAAVRDRARGKFAAPRVALVVARSADDQDGPDAPDGPGVLGFALVTEPTDEMPDGHHDAAYLSLLAVRPGSQGRGTGRALLDAAVGAARAAGRERVVLHALEGNERALTLYRSMGFQPIGEPFAHPLGGRPKRAYVVG